MRSESPQSALDSVEPPKTGGYSVQRAILGPLLVVTFVTLCLLFGVFALDMQKRMQLTLHERGRTVNNAVNHVAGIDGQQLERVVSLLGEEPGTMLIAVASGEPARIIATTQERWRGRLASELEDREAADALMHGRTAHDMYTTRQMHTYSLAGPLRPLRADTSTRGEVRGAVFVRLDLRHYRGGIKHGFWLDSAAALAALLIISVVTWRLLDRHIVRPLDQITTGARARETGDAPIAAPAHAPQKLAQLADALESSFARLRDAESRANAASAAKSEFLARMSHEIRTPMNGVLGMLEALQSTSLDAGQRDHLHTAHASAETLLTLINDILDYSKVEAGRLSIESIPFDVHRLVSQTVQLWRPRAAEKGLGLTVRIDHRCPPWLSGDPTRVGQILNNLLSNAIKFTSIGEVMVALDVDALDSQTAQVRLSVHDTGPGMSSEVVERLFTAFTQADGSTSRRYGGTGLGLAIAQQLAHLMDGEIQVASVEGASSTFTFVMKAALGEQPPQRSVAARGPAATPAMLGRLRVLVVDDNEINRKVAANILRRLEVNASFAVDGSEAVAAVKAGRFDVVLMDCHMPVMDGFQATSAIRAWEAQNNARRLPIFAVSASAFQEDRNRCSAVGMDGFLPKPVSVASIAAMLEGVAEGADRDAGLRSVQAGSTQLHPVLSSAVRDMEQLNSMREIFGDDFDEFVGHFRTNSVEQLSALRAALGHDAAAVKQAAHKLKGAVSAVGAVHMTACCLEIEQRAADGRMEGLDLLVLALDSQLQEVHAAISAAKQSDQVGADAFEQPVPFALSSSKGS